MMGLQYQCPLDHRPYNILGFAQLLPNVGNVPTFGQNWTHQFCCLGGALISWWRHQMETFSALLAICAGHSPITGESPTQRQWRGTLVFSFICARINGWVNNREAGDLRCNCAYYGVTVMVVGWHHCMVNKTWYCIERSGSRVHVSCFEFQNPLRGWVINV